MIRISTVPYLAGNLSLYPSKAQKLHKSQIPTVPYVDVNLNGPICCCKPKLKLQANFNFSSFPYIAVYHNLNSNLSFNCLIYVAFSTPSVPYLTILVPNYCLCANYYCNRPCYADDPIVRQCFLGGGTTSIRGTDRQTGRPADRQAG